MYLFYFKRSHTFNNFNVYFQYRVILKYNDNISFSILNTEQPNWKIVLQNTRS